MKTFLTKSNGVAHAQFGTLESLDTILLVATRILKSLQKFCGSNNDILRL